jgi:hypothetical protein
MTWSNAAAVVLAMAAVAVPFLPDAKPSPSAAVSAWPARYEGRPLTHIAPAPEDRFLARQFPGQVARFSDGHRQIVLRRVAAATRALHPASDCFRAIGYTVTPAAMRLAPDGQPASCFTATRDGRALMVCEQVRDASGAMSWPDISSWYWSALLGGSRGPWTAALTVEQAR